MGAGVSTQRLSSAIRRQLKRIQNDLAGRAIPSIYERFTLTGSGGNTSFTVTYRVSRASNGETAIWPVFSIYNRATKKTETMGTEGDERVWTSRERGITRITELYREVPIV